MTAARWARHSLELDHESKLDQAISAGYDPHEDPNQPVPAHLRVPEGVDALAVFAAQVEAARHANECAVCGSRCVECGERLCSTNGPEPAPRCADHLCCVECSDHVVYCGECKRVMAGVAEDKAADNYRETRHGA